MQVGSIQLDQLMIIFFGAPPCLNLLRRSQSPRCHQNESCLCRWQHIRDVGPHTDYDDANCLIWSTAHFAIRRIKLWIIY
jgi:hypothetical protein